MKANTAPEKIYINPNIEHRIWLIGKSDANSVEYIDADAFIEKALDYIENNIYDHYDGDNEYGVCGGYVKKEEFIKNFKNHMKGE